MIKEETIRETMIHDDGTEEVKEVKKTSNITRNDEPDYIKLYTKMWCEFNMIPERWHSLFFELVTRMSYADITDKDGGQVVMTGGYTKQSICRRLNIKDNNYQKGLKALCDCGALKKLCRGSYQINPKYAGKGEWKYNPVKKRGGVKDLIAKFDFADRNVNVNIVWTNDNPDPNNDKERIMLGLGMNTDELIETHIREESTGIPYSPAILAARYQ